MTRRALLPLVLCGATSAASAAAAASCGSKSGGPVDAPTSTLYGAGSYPWAEGMVPWSCVYNVKDYAGTPDDAFAAAQAAALAASPPGGVVYFPAGSYAFTKLIPLASNVVIRGAPTTQPAKSGKAPGPLAPSTVFTCPKRAHLGVFSLATNNSGVVNIEMDGCAVMLWPELGPGGQTFSWPTDFENYWYSAKSILSLGANKLVLSNQVHDVSFGYPSPAQPPAGQNEFPWVFSTAIACYGSENVLVGNNLVRKSDDQTSPVTLRLKESNGTYTNITTTYPTDDRYGIDVGRVLLGAVLGASNNPGGACPSEWGTITPACMPWLFPTGVTIRDNYVYQNGRVGVSFASGLPANESTTIGAGAQVTNNHVEVAAGTVCWTVRGTSFSTGSDTNENRGYDKAGYGANITFNTGHINSQHASNTPYMTVDGEGILQQPGQNSAGLYDSFHSNDLSGSGSAASIWYYNLPNAAHGVLLNNTAGNPSVAFIGVLMIASYDTASGFTASGNTPAAQYCYPPPAPHKAHQCDPIPPPS
jgi:hypothetical protein